MKGFSKLTDADKEIVLAFAENNMDTSKTARSSVYHRNTIKYHLEQIQKKTKLDPRRFYDLVELVSAIKKDGDA